MDFLALAIALDEWRPGTPRSAHIPHLLTRLEETGQLDPEEADLLRDAWLDLRIRHVALQLPTGRDVTRFTSPPAPLRRTGPRPVRAGVPACSIVGNLQRSGK